MRISHLASELTGERAANPGGTRAMRLHEYQLGQQGPTPIASTTHVAAAITHVTDLAEMCTAKTV